MTTIWISSTTFTWFENKNHGFPGIQKWIASGVYPPNWFQGMYCYWSHDTTFKLNGQNCWHDSKETLIQKLQASGYTDIRTFPENHS